MGIELKRNLSGVRALQPGEFFSSPTPHTPGRGLTVTISCPLCGGLNELGPVHRVDGAGRVTPSLSCASCPLLEWITLCGWRDPP